MFMLMNIGLKSIFSRAVLQFFPCSEWSGKKVIFKYAISFRVAATYLSNPMELQQE